MAGAGGGGCLSDPLPGEFPRGSARAGGRGGAGGGADRLDRGPAGVPAVFGADLSPRLALRAGGESGPGFGLVAGVVGGGIAQAGRGAGRGVSRLLLRTTRTLISAARRWPRRASCLPLSVIWFVWNHPLNAHGRWAVDAVVLSGEPLDASILLATLFGVSRCPPWSYATCLTIFISGSRTPRPITVAP